MSALRHILAVVLVLPAALLFAAWIVVLLAIAIYAPFNSEVHPLFRLLGILIDVGIAATVGIYLLATERP